MKLRTTIAYLSQVLPTYILQSTEAHAMTFTDAQAVRQFMADNAELLPACVECVA